MERNNGHRKERARRTPFARTELSGLEGVRIDNGEKTLRFWPIDSEVVRVRMSSGTEHSIEEVRLPNNETFQRELCEGKTISIMGGEVGLNGRQFVMYIPTELKARKIKFIPKKK